MTLRSENELRAIAELLDAIKKFQRDSSHDMILIGILDFFDGLPNLRTGKTQITGDNGPPDNRTESDKIAEGFKVLSLEGDDNGE